MIVKKVVSTVYEGGIDRNEELIPDGNLVTLVLDEIRERKVLYLNFLELTQEYCFIPEATTLSHPVSYLFPQRVLDLIGTTSQSEGKRLTLTLNCLRAQKPEQYLLQSVTLEMD